MTAIAFLIVCAYLLCGVLAVGVLRGASDEYVPDGVAILTWIAWPLAALAVIFVSVTFATYILGLYIGTKFAKLWKLF